MRKKVMNHGTNTATRRRDEKKTKGFKMGASQERRKACEKEQNMT